MTLWPKEHGAYGQLIVPQIAAFAVAGVSLGGAFVAAAVVAGFLAHEPAAVIIGLRGPRARRETGRHATTWLLACLVVGAVALLGAVWTTTASARWSLAVPAVPALVVAMAMLGNREKSWLGEVAAALAFSGAAVPVVIAGGVEVERALAVAIPFALLFVTTTLAVRVVILRVRGGGNPRAVAATRRAAIAVTGGGVALLALLSGARLLPLSILMAAAPGLVAAGTIALYPPSPAKLRRVGWTLVGVSLLTVALVVSTA
jgi:hypothetical protein